MPLSIQFPIIEGPQGFISYTDDQTTAAINQNLKMLLLTRKGEYTFDVNFGAGLGEFLFAMNTTETHEEMTSVITQQIQRYMPYVVLQDISYNTEEADNNALGVTIAYTINEDLKVQYLHLHVNI
tara:strand:- start:523 stop:897 length:375 start_codon:yes stop_codon:yes gene_type:complete